MQLRAGVFPSTSQIFRTWSMYRRHRFVQLTISLPRPIFSSLSHWWEKRPHVAQLWCVRTMKGRSAGFIGVEHDKVEMLFVHPTVAARESGAG